MSATAGADSTTGPQTPASAPTTVQISVAAGTDGASTSEDSVLTVTSTPAAGGQAPPGSDPTTEATAGSAAGTTTSSDGDTGLIAETTLAAAPADAEAPLLQLAFDVEAGSSVALAADGTGAVASPSGDLTVGFTAPVVADAAGTTLPASWRVPDTGTSDDDGDQLGLAVDLVTDPPAAAYPLTVTVHLGTTVVAGAEWGNREGGESLVVTPSAWGRVSGQTGETFGWADVVGREPAADTSVMEMQFRCHQLGAPDKATWNLEPWRPDVSYLDYLVARCNPT
ncbi:Protein of unknown function [Sanguibacter gelidistatuariae]|uniref:DUF2599 domain-containing protein n=1 Tax=Sanguibacter gelidistatuariae TaxID=1814289 RepID=A0A1G6HEW3_9MICO|nr:DUF2599 domain-containing protein [Sanguibacter gelidistatuariae]SDB92658.1 Protein of unknown function [Sanguibacter gelidistatuariae]